MSFIGFVRTAGQKIIVSDLCSKLSRKYFVFARSLCTLTKDSASLSEVPPSLSYFCGPAIIIHVEKYDRQFTHSCLGLSPDMKHKKKRSSKHEHRRRKKRLEKDKKKKRETVAVNRLKHLAMASGFQGSVKTIHLSEDDDDDDIVVVYDKLNGEAPRKDPNEHKKCEALQDIPLPSETFASPFRMAECLRLADIPLPSTPYRRVPMDKLSEIEMDAKEIESRLKEFRKWEHTDLGKTLLQNGDSPSTELQDPNSFTIMSYNVLAQKLLEDHKYLYRKHDFRSLAWEFRSKVLLREIKEANADVLCLQEVQADHLDSFYSKLKDLGYEGIYKRRSASNHDGCAIYFKSDKFCLIESSTVEYFQDYLNAPCILDRNNVAIIAKLALKNSIGSENHVVVATTHLLYNPRRHDIKLAQAQVLMAELDRVSFIGTNSVNGRPNYLPTIVTGDFNLQPDTAVYRFLREGFLFYAELASRSLTCPFYRQPLQEFVLPYELQISKYSQHLGLVLHRLKHTNNLPLNKCVDVSKVTKLYNSERYKSPHDYARKQSQTPLLNEEDFYRRDLIEGCLRHALNLQSVYQHERQKSPTNKKMVREATTHQDDWVTVDYIFYSGNWNHQNNCVEEGRLKLLSRYTLPSCGQCQELKSIPNLACGSDHLSLMARFLLNTE